MVEFMILFGSENYIFPVVSTTGYPTVSRPTVRWWLMPEERKRESGGPLAGVGSRLVAVASQRHSHYKLVRTGLARTGQRWAAGVLCSFCSWALVHGLAVNGSVCIRLPQHQTKAGPSSPPQFVPCARPGVLFHPLKASQTAHASVPVTLHCFLSSFPLHLAGARVLKSSLPPALLLWQPTP
ncbi:hypothetical protein IF1G_08170 [Cordyceps javanica]|uniref:Uncharacterized protein n=1 Tax=Cordyceps javanica TaxID=43265 RepID=A0A545UTR7_9HYPO|nr:hypothetical protein IF1G_08170 [Cordyceps javanica]